MNNLDLKEIIRNAQTQNKEANVAAKYYDGEHDILKNRIIVVDDKGIIRDDMYSSNIRIPHPYFTELVQQAANYIFSEPVKFSSENKLLGHLLETYITSDTQEMLYEAVEEASIKGREWVYAYRDRDGLVSFMNVDARQVTEITDDYGNTRAVIRYFDDTAQVWDNKEKKTYQKNDKGDYELVDTVKHTVVTPDGNVEGYGRIPWFKLKNNKNETTDLKHIKPFIDDYDIMNSYASNDLQDFRGKVHVLKSDGDVNMSQFKVNVTNTGMVKMPEDADYSVQTHDVDIDAREKKMIIDEENIYKIGHGYNTHATRGISGHTSNVAIKAAQEGFKSKCSKKKLSLRKLLDWMLEFILDDIERRGLGSYGLSDIDIEFTHKLLENEKESAEVEQAKETARKTQIEALLSVEHVLDELTMLEQVSKLLELDIEEVKKRKQTQDYGTLIEEG